MSFYEKLAKVWIKNDSLLCVGLDSDLDRIPAHLRTEKNPLFSFNCQIIDATVDLVCAYKPQIAYYAAQNARKELELTLEYLRDKHAEIPVILDAKRGDIVPTAKMFAREAFELYKADAVTVNPFMGGDTLKPFFDWKEKGTIVICRTSNPGSKEFQDLEVIGGGKIYKIIAKRAAEDWNVNKNVALVVGANHPEELKEIREIVGDMPLLVPGVGAQEADIRAAVLAGLDSRGAGMIINSSRKIIYAGSGKDFAAQARAAARKLRDDINRHRA